MNCEDGQVATREGDWKRARRAGGHGQAHMQDGGRCAQTRAAGNESLRAGWEPSTQPLQTSLLGLVCTLCTLRAHKIIKLSESLGRKAG